ncbi:MAG: hypothetical protein ACR2PH_01190 [Desulfobulbia bacterium]
MAVLVTVVVFLFFIVPSLSQEAIIGLKTDVEWTDDGTYITCPKKMNYQQAKTCYWKICEGDIGTVPMGSGTYKFCARMKALMKKRNDYRIP